MDPGYSPAPNAIQYRVLLCLPTAPALPMRGTETSVRRRFFRAALGQTAACLYLLMCGLRCKAQWVSRNKPPAPSCRQVARRPGAAERTVLAPFAAARPPSAFEALRTTG